MRKAVLLACAIILSATSLAAHDFWLAAADWQPAQGAPATITAGIGERFPARSIFRVREDWLTSWRILGPDGDIPTSTGWAPQGLEQAHTVPLLRPGAYLGVAVVTARTIQMKGPEFTDYLMEEGLQAIVEARKAAGESELPAIERFGRYAKIALRSGPGAASHLLKPAGLAAEFVPAVDPTSIRPGQTLTLQFLVEGTPTAGAAVSAVAPGGAVQKHTDAQGRVTFAIDREGPWLIKTIHMRRLPPNALAEWESHWATLTFHTSR